MMLNQEQSVHETKETLDFCQQLPHSMIDMTFLKLRQIANEANMKRERETETETIFQCCQGLFWILVDSIPWT